MIRLLLCCTALMAQVRDGGIDVSASRSVTLAATEAQVSVTARAPAGATSAQVAAALQELGVQERDLVSVSADETALDIRLPGGETPARQFSAGHGFAFTVPAARLEEVTAVLDRFTRTPPKPVVSLSYQANQVPSSAEVEQARLRLLPELFAEAKREAEAQFAAAGQAPGPVVYVSDQAQNGYGSTSASFSVFLRMAAQAATAVPQRSVGVIARQKLEAGAFDLVDVRVSAASSSMATLAQAVEFVKPLGIGERELIARSSSGSGAGAGLGAFLLGGEGQNSFDFAFTRPATALPQLLEKLAALPSSGQFRASISASLSYSAGVLQAARARATPALLELARQQAEPLARLLNLPLRSVRTISSAADPVGTLVSRTPQFRWFSDFAASVESHSLAVEFAVE